MSLDASTLATLARFRKFVSYEDENGCHVWTGARSKAGYGRFMFDGKARQAHRVAYEHLVRPIPDGLHIDHLCRNKLCVNPAHLEPVTQAENSRRAGVAIELCANGHAFTEANTATYNGRRACLICRRILARANYRRRKGEMAAAMSEAAALPSRRSGAPGRPSPLQPQPVQEGAADVS